MSKDAYYFPHDSNAKDDPKCVLLLEQLGPEGYGIYWILIETLRDQPDYKYPISLLSALARRYNTTPEKMKTVVSAYKLFEIDEQDFFSLSLNRRMETLEKKREQQRLAGKASAEKRLLLNAGSTTVQRPFNDRSTSKVKKSKEKEKKTIYAEQVTLFEKEYQKLIDQFGESDAKERIERLSLYKLSKGKKYASDYATILAWARKEQQKPKVSLSQKTMTKAQADAMDKYEYIKLIQDGWQVIT